MILIVISKLSIKVELLTGEARGSIRRRRGGKGSSLRRWMRMKISEEQSKPARHPPPEKKNIESKKCKPSQNSLSHIKSHSQTRMSLILEVDLKSLVLITSRCKETMSMTLILGKLFSLKRIRNRNRKENLISILLGEQLRSRKSNSNKTKAVALTSWTFSVE